MADNNIWEYLLSQQDLGYRDFTLPLLPNIDEKTFIGVRLPVLKKYAKDLDVESREAFLKDLPHRYHEENILHAFILSNIKDYETFIRRVDAFLPFVTNWSVCDTLCNKYLTKYRDKLIQEVYRWLESDEPYRVRYAVKCLMNYYLGEDFVPEHIERVAKVKLEDYYVRMMIAWYLATGLAKNYDAFLLAIEQRRFDIFTHNKAIQKAVESFRVSDEHKTYLKTLKGKRRAGRLFDKLVSMKKKKVTIIALCSLVGVLSLAIAIPFTIYGIRSGNMQAEYAYLKTDASYAKKVEAHHLNLVTQHISCGYATIEMMSAHYGSKVTEDELDKRNRSITTATSYGFLAEINKSIPSKHFVLESYLKKDDLLKTLHSSLSKGDPAVVEWAAQNDQKEWTLHFSVVGALDLPNDVVTVYNPYGYIENITTAEFLGRTSFESYEGMPLYMNFGFAYGMFHRNALFVLG